MAKVIIPCPDLPPRNLDLAGSVFGRLTVLAYAGRLDTFQPAHWLCLCVCGNLKVVSKRNLVESMTRSCGCLWRERAARAARRHGMSGNRSYDCWRGILRRCLDPKTKSFNNYGGRGIRVCERWMKFDNFAADMGPRPDKGSIERRDNDGNYCPENCHWATQTEQQNNKRNTIRLTIGGVTKTTAEWARIHGVKRNTLTWRLRCGRTPEQAVAKPESK